MLDGHEFTDIYVDAFVKNGDGGSSDDMTAVAHIQIGGNGQSLTVHCEAEANVSDYTGGDGAYSLAGDRYDGCNSWYWSVDTRNNGGVGTALCKWRWHQFE